VPLSLTIPDEVAAAMKLPPRRLESELRKELAVHLVAEGILSASSACRLAGMPRLAFERLLGERRISLGAAPEDLDKDLTTLSAE
jgi:predicted HTH domain antitoxin